MKLQQALNKIRETQGTDLCFGLVFLTQTSPCQVRKVEKARLRAVPTNHRSHDSFLYFTDTERNLARQCRKRLIRQVKINDQWHKVEL